MTHPTEPPVPPVDDAASYVSAADDYVAPVTDDEDGDESDDSGSGDGGKGLKSPRSYEVILDSLLDFADDPNLSDDENAEIKLEKLGLTPMSILASGASAFASENELTRKIFMAKIGLVNAEIKPRDIANPQLVRDLDAKQAERRRIFGIKTLDEIVTGAMGAAGMMVGAITASVADYVKDKREEKRVNRQIKDYESGKEEYALDSEDELESISSLEQADFPVQEVEPDNRVLEYLRDLQEMRNNKLDDDGASPLMLMFNDKATVVAPDRVKSIKIDTDILNIDLEIQDIYKDFNPTGG